MKNGFLKSCVSVAALISLVSFAGASQSAWALSDSTLCAIATYSCTENNRTVVNKKKKALCDKASLNNTATEIKIWDSNQRTYINQAKARGLTCGVTPNTSDNQPTLCTNYISECSTSKVCDRATFQGKWKSNSNKYVVEAKKRGLSCGAVSTSSTTNLNLSNNEVCERASYGVDRKWLTTSSVFYKYVLEAKKRGLSCGVEASSSITSTPSGGACLNVNSLCNNNYLCSVATRGINTGERVWQSSTSVFYEFVIEAKKRDLSCNVKTSNSVQKPSSLPTCSPSYIKDSKICIDEFICTRATTLLNNKWAWYSNTHSFYKYAVEAKRRGLACGVDSSSPKPMLETKVTKPVLTVPVKKQKKIGEPLASLNNPLHFKSYGNAYHTPLLPNVIFFIGEIKDGNERGFRKALRNHKVDTVVLISDGGLVGTGLELANIINDNNLSTYVPLGESCASACSFMFFAGKSKVAHGRLGVHQFYVDDDKKKMAVGKVQKGTQYLIGDIIENLEAFGTPSSVYPKMLSTSGMYFFSEEEKSDFNSKPINPELIRKMNEVLVYLSMSVDNNFDDSTLNSMPTNIKNSLTQLELVRIGCMKGPVDGVKGKTTMSAIKLFSSKIGSNFSSGKFSSLFRVLNNTKEGACY